MWIHRARDSGALPPLDGVHGVTLVASCQNERDATTILNAYGCASMSAADVKASLEPRRDTPLLSFAVVVKSGVLLKNAPRNPAVVAFRSVDHWNSAFIEWRSRDQPHIGLVRGGIPEFPEFDVVMGSQSNPPFAPMDTLLQEATEQFLFVAAYGFEEFVTV